MKRHIINDWLKDNPFVERITLLEQPITDQLPDSNISPEGEQNPVEQDPMQGSGPVQQEPELGQQDSVDQPEMDSEIDFNTEKIDYMDLGIGQKHDEMMDKLLEMRQVSGLTSGQYKFIDDNIQVLTLLRDVDINSAQKKIYRQIKDGFGSMAEPVEKSSITPQTSPAPIETEPNISSGEENMQKQNVSPTNPPFESYNFGNGLKNILEQDEGLGEVSGTEVISILSEEIERYEEIKNAFIKLPSFYGMKADLFRKLVCSLTNGIQIGSGGFKEDVFIPLAEGGVGIKLCTRCYIDFGNIEIGKWNIKFNDPETYLGEDELEKLNISGSPEEKEVLRKRVVIESIASRFQDKIYFIGVINPYTGVRKEIGFNFSEVLREGWKNGIITVSFKANIGKGEAAINVDGELIDLQDIVLEYVRENSDELDEQGRPVKEYIELIRQRSGDIYLSIGEEDFDSFTQDNISGIFYTTKTPEIDVQQLDKIRRCVPSITELLLKKC